MNRTMTKLIVLITAMAVLSIHMNLFALEEGGQPEEKGVVEKERPTASADVAFLSKYIWRGYELSNDSMVIQPSVIMGYKGFSVNLWGNLDTRFDDGDPTTGDTSRWTETDFTVAYDHTLGPVNLGGGYIYYALDGTTDSQEFYFSVGGNVLLTPTLTMYREIAHLPAWYFNLGISHSFSLPHGISLDLAGSVGYYDSLDADDLGDVREMRPGVFVDTGEKYQHFHDGNLSVSMTFPFAKYFSITPVVSYSFPLSSDADDLLKSTSISGDSSHFYGGVSLSMSF